MALGIGANAAILGVVDATRPRPLPFDDASSLVRVWMEGDGRAKDVRGGLTAADLLDLRAEPGLFGALAGWRAARPDFVGVSTERTLEAAEVTVGLFAGVLRVQPFLGRVFLPEEDEPGAVPVVLLAHRFWRDELGGDPGAIGRSVVLDGEPHVVVGVMPPGFRPPFRSDAELWMPARLPKERCRRACPTLVGVARLAPGTTLPVARDRALAFGRRLEESYPDTNRGVVPSVGPLQDPPRISAATVRLLATAGALALLIACANVALLLLARGMHRSRELRLRWAVGASQGAITRQLLRETVGLVAVGALLGFGLAAWGVEALVRAAPPGLFAAAAPSVDGWVLLAVAALTALSGLLAGVVPAFAGSRFLASASMRRRPSGSSERRSRRWGRLARGGIGAVQLGLATLLLVAAGGLARSLHSATHEALGFDPTNVLALHADLDVDGAASAWESPATRAARVSERLEAVPGVFAVGVAGSLPFEGTEEPVRVRVEDQVASHDEPVPTVTVRPVSDAYFYTMGQRLSEGRAFRPDDDPDAEPVAILTAAAVRRLLSDPPRAPVGARIALGDGPPSWRTVVGVVRDEWVGSELRPSEPVVYVPLGQSASRSVVFVARVDVDPASVVPELRTALAQAAPELQAVTVEPLEGAVGDAFAGERFATLLAGTSAAAALLLSVVGLFGVLSHAVASGLGELGLRRALGASDDDLRRHVVGRGLAIAAAGAAAGAVGVRLFIDGVDAVFAGVGLRTPMVYAAVVTVVGLGVLLASLWPAGRAASVDAVSALGRDTSATPH